MNKLKAMTNDEICSVFTSHFFSPSNVSASLEISYKELLDYINNNMKLVRRLEEEKHILFCSIVDKLEDMALTGKNTSILIFWHKNAKYLITKQNSKKIINTSFSNIYEKEKEDEVISKLYQIALKGNIKSIKRIIEKELWMPIDRPPVYIIK